MAVGWPAGRSLCTGAWPWPGCCPAPILSRPGSAHNIKAVNQLLVVGFYLVNFGYACLLLKADPARTAIAAIETLAAKLGFLLLSLAAMHFTNLYVFHRIRRRAQLATMPVPVAPQARLA